jgi:plasmid maintenance system antidote protein VapI
MRKEKPMSVNLNLKAELIKRFGSQIEAAKAIGIRENRLSYIIRGHVQPSDAERKSLEHAFGKAATRRLLETPRLNGEDQ